MHKSDSPLRKMIQIAKGRKAKIPRGFENFVAPRPRLSEGMVAPHRRLSTTIIGRKNTQPTVSPSSLMHAASKRRAGGLAGTTR